MQQWCAYAMLICCFKSSPEVVCATIQVGHHAIVDGQERKEALSAGLQHREDVYGPLPTLAHGMRSCHRSPQAAIGCQSVARAAGDEAEWRLDALLPVRPLEIPLGTQRILSRNIPLSIYR